MFDSCHYGVILDHACTHVLYSGDCFRFLTSACLLQTLVSRLFSNFQDSSYLLTYTSLASNASKNTMCIFHNNYETWNRKQYKEQVWVESQKFPRNPRLRVLKTALRFTPLCNDSSSYMLAVIPVNPWIPWFLLPFPICLSPLIEKLSEERVSILHMHSET